MRFLKIGCNGTLNFTTNLEEPPGPYAILSHRWCSDNDEITFEEWNKDSSKHKPGYEKVAFCAAQARKDGLQYIWVDTCCINRNNLVELDEAIRSMFRWYHNATKCYVYLQDVVLDHADDKATPHDWKSAFRNSTWFRRGWTLQELLAPRIVEFFSRDRQLLGTKTTLKEEISEITEIPVEALRGEDLANFSIEERFRWAEGRETTKKEDKAYCLFGIFNVFLPLMYGEKDAAFERLKQEIGITASQIDSVIQTSYQERHLAVERLSGKLLPLEKCFINLCIIDYNHNKPTTEVNDDKLLSKFSLEARLKVETLPKTKQVCLSAMFDFRKRKDGSNARPERILIWGGAGTGKTTLCKKIVHDFYHNGLWRGLYDRVIWLPLRRMKLMQREAHDVIEFVQWEFFLNRAEKNLRERLKGVILHDKRTLFILDGLDEVSYAFDPDAPNGRLLNSLIVLPNVIITSRPHSTGVLDHMPPDLELETTGFSTEQVVEYIQRTAQESNMSDDTIVAIQSFIERNPLVQSLSRIPVQLDAICYVWNTRHFPKDTVTMTKLYKAISQRLWAKDIVRLGKTPKWSAQPMTKQQIEQYSNIEIHVKEEDEFLQQLAFHGLCNEIVEFDNAVIARISTGSCIMGDAPVHMSFLRSSDNSLEAPDRTLHFIHLTFQEYFAARYFVRHWISYETLSVSKHSPYEPSKLMEVALSPKDFLKTEKYTNRFDIFWRFVTGLLQQEADHSHLHRLLKSFDEEPFDIVGRRHHHFIIHCLSEVSLIDDEIKLAVRQREQNCFNWLLSCSNLGLWLHQCLPIWEAEYSDYILDALLMKPKLRNEVINSLYERPYVTSSLLKTILATLQQETDLGCRQAAIQVLARHCSTYHETTLLTYWRNLPALSTTERLEVVAALKEVALLQRPAIEAMTALLHDSDQAVRSGAIKALCNVDDSHVLPSILENILPLLYDQDKSVRFATATGLRHQSSLPISAINTLVTLLDDPDEEVRYGAVRALGRQSDVPAVVINTIVALLNHPEDRRRSDAALALCDQSSLPDSAIDALTFRVHDSDSTVQWNAIFALGHQSSLSSSVIDTLVSLLHTSNAAKLSLAAASALSQQSNLPSSAVDTIITLFHNQNNSTLADAGYALSGQSNLHNSAMNALIILLGHPEQSVRWNALNALSRQSSLPSSAVNAITALLNDQDLFVRSRAASVLSRHSDLPKAAIDALVTLLDDSEYLSSTEYLNVPVFESSLPMVTDTLVARLNRPEKPLQVMAAARVLVEDAAFYQRIPELGSYALQGVIRALLDKESVHCSIWNGNFRTEVNGKLRNYKLQAGQQEVFENAWSEAQAALGFAVRIGSARKQSVKRGLPSTGQSSRKKYQHMGSDRYRTR